MFGINIYSIWASIIFSFWGLTLTYLYFQIPLMIVIITPAIDGIKKEWGEAAATLGATTWQYWRMVVIPVLWPSFLGTVILLFANAFGAVATAYALTGPSLNIVPIQLFAQIRGDVLYNPQSRLRAGVRHDRHHRSGQPLLHLVPDGGRSAGSMMKNGGRFWAWITFGLGAAYFFILPLLATFEFSLRMRRGAYSFDAYSVVLGDPNFQATFLYSIVVADLHHHYSACLLVVPTAYWIRLRMPHLRPIVEFITLLPLVIPAIVIVFGYIRMFGSNSPLPFLATARGTDVLLVIGYAMLALPYMYRAVDTGLRTIDVRTLTEAAQILGAGWTTIITRVILPNVLIAVLSGAFLTFAIVIGEFTMASLLNRPAFGPYLQNIGANRAYEPSALAIISFAITWGCMSLIQILSRFAPKSANRPN